MSYWNQPDRPVDRAVQELERQIAAVQRQRREMEYQGKSGRDISPERGSFATVAEFVRRIVKPTRQTAPEPFDVGDEPLKELEAKPIPFACEPTPDLFGPAVKTAPAEQKDSRLMRYLSTGSLRTYKPLKSEQRRQRHRFFVWLGLSFVALWILYVVVR